MTWTRLRIAALWLTLACGASPQSKEPVLRDSEGDNVSIFNRWPSRRWEISRGTAASPVSDSGPLFKISKTESLPTTACNGNQVDNECNAALSVNALQTVSSQMQANAIFAGATGSSAFAGSPDVVAIHAVGRVTGRGVGIGTGAYLSGRRDTPTGKAVGLEARVENETPVDGSYNNAGISDTNGIWVTTSSSVNSNSGAAVSVGGTGSSKWITGLGFVAGSVVRDSIHDNSSSVNSLNIEGTHTFAIRTSPTAGAISLGGNVTLPHVIGSKNTANISAGDGAGTNPTVHKSGTDLAGQIAVQTGAAPAPDAPVVTVMFGTAYDSMPYCVYSPSSASAAALSGSTQVRIGSTAKALTLTSGPAALPAGNYVWNYICAQ